MPAPIDDPQHRRDSANEIRALLEDVKDEASKQKMLRIADDYERLAKRAHHSIGLLRTWPFARPSLHPLNGGSQPSNLAA